MGPLFGFWHVAPALAGGSANQAVDEVVGGGLPGLLLRVAGTVLFTAATGVVSVICGCAAAACSPRCSPTGR
ncbi:MAG TPA: hypothetical protein VIU11_12440 [Nakamurella sp.]